MEELRFPEDRGCFGCSPSNPVGLGLRFYREGNRVFSRYRIAERFHGAPGVAHGGIVATIFDEVCCATAVFVTNSYVVTGELTVRYEAPCPVESELEFSAWVEDDGHPRYAVIRAQTVLDGNVLARAGGRFFYTSRKVSAP